jgi:hypothetical protein
MHRRPPADLAGDPHLVPTSLRRSCGGPLDPPGAWRALTR